MKIGIVTIRMAENYGQRLQNFALHTILTQMGNDVETIENYYNVDYDERAPWPSLRTAYRMVRYAHWPVRRAMADWKRRAAFRKFNERIPISPWAVNNEEANLEPPNRWNERYDAFIAGSDQVWNTAFRITSPLNFLNFAEKDKRLSYAAGVCVDAEELNKHDWAVKSLKEMRWLSIRETQSALEVEKATGRKATIDLDPTLLFEGSQWEKLLKLPKQKSKRKKYLLLYTLSKHSDGLVAWAKDMARRNGWKIIELKNWEEPAYQKGPQEFVRLIRDAQLVATDSFHGTVFSLLMRTPFAIADRSGELEEKMNDRLVTLLRQAGIEERTYNRLTEQTLFSVDFDKAEKNFAYLRQQSIQNLWNSLQPRRKECGQKPVLAPVQLCTGCAACVASCTIHAVSMRPDKEGFLFPQVDFEKCVKCGACTESCPICSPGPVSKVPDTALAAWAKDEKLREQSSSGGVFGLLARETLRQGGCVFGAAMEEALTVRHRMVESEAELAALQGSKYVQSEIGDTYSQAKTQLKAGRPVLFSGTPCQIAGLKSYLKRNYDNLLSVQVICHGAPSPLAWKLYAQEIIGALDGREKYINFRDKALGWKNFSLGFFNGEILTQRKSFSEDNFMRAFLRHLCLRKSCETCLFKGENAQGDIVLGDFWGIEDVFPQVNDDKGVSIVLAFTVKGESTLWEILQQMETRETLTETAMRKNRLFYISSVPHPNHNLFFENLGKMPFDALVERCLAEDQSEWRKEQLLKPVHWVSWTFLPQVKRKVLSLLHKC